MLRSFMLCYLSSIIYWSQYLLQMSKTFLIWRTNYLLSSEKFLFLYFIIFILSETFIFKNVYLSVLIEVRKNIFWKSSTIHVSKRIYLKFLNFFNPCLLLLSAREFLISIYICQMYLLFSLCFRFIVVFINFYKYFQN